ncbi:hypothetical protein M407DRAFT_139563 [Tulasnella calospora MUT 4182]|uniref:Uncharacterized protein n=1 Tax=Tulasnella calospora MUT 4182 TaxID=1051891 RepID=A0A0C3KFH1_9AGAM|nr:hypothetical protein M407DRAFT_139563 [Tulasnella calospora MUT 4182]
MWATTFDLAGHHLSLNQTYLLHLIISLRGTAFNVVAARWGHLTIRGSLDCQKTVLQWYSTSTLLILSAYRSPVSTTLRTS